MGIKGLVTFCKNNACYEEYDLVAVSKRQQIEILVDFYGIEQHIIDLTIKNLASKYKNEYLAIPGAEYDEMVSAFREFYQVFKNLGIKLVFVIDGPKGLDKESLLNKGKSWIYRFEKTLRLHHNYIEYCKNPQGPYQVIREILVRPYLLQDLFKGIVHREGGTVISLVYGEADYQIADLRKQRNSWAVLTNDSDFFSFANCPTIQIAFFDLDRDLMMGRNYRSSTDGYYCCLNPKKLLVGVISGEILMTRLCISSFDKLIDFSILMGNDYTTDFAVELRNACNIEWQYDDSDIADCVSLAKWVEGQNVRLTETEQYKKFIVKYPEAEHFVEYSKNFYKCEIYMPIQSYTSLKNERLWNYIVKRYQNVDIPSIALSVFHGFCYQKNCVEPHIESQHDINHLLIPLRKLLYALFLQEGKSVVIEYEVPNCEGYVREIKIDENCQKINDIVNPDVQFSYHAIDLKISSWKFFEESWSYWDFENSPKRYFRSLDFFRKHGTDLGFCCYCLRTLYLNTDRKHNDYSSSSNKRIVITDPEFRAIFCAVIFRMLTKLRNFKARWDVLYQQLITPYPNSWFYQLRVCPSSICLNIQEWLQSIYRLAYVCYGRSLRISHFFPESYEFISGSVLTVFYEYVHNNGQRLRNVDSVKVNEIYELMNYLYDEFHFVYETILQPF